MYDLTVSKGKKAGSGQAVDEDWSRGKAALGLEDSLPSMFVWWLAGGFPAWCLGLCPVSHDTAAAFLQGVTGKQPTRTSVSYSDERYRCPTHPTPAVSFWLLSPTLMRGRQGPHTVWVTGRRGCHIMPLFKSKEAFPRSPRFPFLSVGESLSHTHTSTAHSRGAWGHCFWVIMITMQLLG